jgi:S-disulfanyl-L-cysteine oxidoreductase SoxD
MRPVRLLSAGLLATALAGSGCAAQQGPASSASVPIGLFSVEQATLGEATYRRACGECHAIREHANPDFRFKWNGRPAFDLFETIRNTMPENDPGSLAREEYAAIVAYMLKVNGLVAGPRALPADSAALRATKLDLKEPGR